MTGNPPLLPLLDAEEVVARLRSMAPSIRHVEAIPDLATAQDILSVAPSAWVIPASMAADRGPIDAQVVSQTVEFVFAIVLAIPMRPHELGEGGSTELLRVQQQSMAALLGWYPSHAQAPTWYVRGDITGYNPDILWWEDLYATQIDIHQSRT